jgi:hypothetical protein
VWLSTIPIACIFLCCGGCMMMAMIGAATDKGRETTSSAKGTSDWSGFTAITDDYLPHKVGATAQYTIEMGGGKTMTHRYFFADSNRIAHNLEAIGHQDVSQPEASDRRVTQDGFIGVVASDGSWPTCLKIGATKGATWEKSGVKYRFDSVGTFTTRYDGRQRTAITIVSELNTDNGNMVATAVYAKGIGLVRKDVEMPGARSAWRLKEPPQGGDLTEMERRFYR